MKQILINRPELRFYLLPKETMIPKGDYSVISLQDEMLNVDEVFLKSFEVKEEEVATYLKTSYQKALEATKQGLQDLNKFSLMTGIGGETDVKNFLTNETKSWSVDEQGTFHQVKELFEEIIGNANQENISEKEGKTLFQNTFKKVPDILSYFEDSKLKEAANDPEAWANEMKEKLFGDIERKKKEAAKEKLREEVRANIAERLREAGVKPNNFEN